MPDKLHWETVAPLLTETLTILSKHQLFQSFRLVGGTSLSLQLGHRMSDDIDLFTDAPYDSIDFKAIDTLLRNTFSYVSVLQTGPVGMGKSMVALVRNETINRYSHRTNLIYPPRRKTNSHFRGSKLFPFFDRSYNLGWVWLRRFS